MQTTPSTQPLRGKYTGMWQIIRFNWSAYLTAGLVCAAMLVALAMFPGLTRVRWLALAAVACTSYWILASMLASYWIYDRSGICDWSWIRETLSAAPQCWAHIHVGFDECSGALKQMFPDSEGVILDVFDDAVMTASSISVARRIAAKRSLAPQADFRALPLANAEVDTVFLVFAAHEIRNPEARLAFFREVHRVVKPGGGVLLAEHLRDFNNFLVFGPGCFHFQSRGAWIEAAKGAQFTVETEFTLTPFVRIFLLRRPA